MSELRKVSKYDARYQSHPKGTQRCGLCTMFQPPEGCTKVNGEISRNGWCWFFEHKGSAAAKAA